MLNINSRNNYTEHGIIKIMDFLIDTIFIVFVEIMLQQTIHQQEIQLEQPKCALLLVDYGNLVLPSSLTYQQIYSVT